MKIMANKSDFEAMIFDELYQINHGWILDALPVIGKPLTRSMKNYFFLREMKQQ